MLRTGLDRLEQKYNPALVRVGICALVFGVVFSSGVVYTISQPRYYESRARLWVQPKVPSSYSANPAEQLSAPFYNSFTSPITTASEVMHSTAVVKEAHDTLTRTLHGEKVPSFDEIRSRLKVSPVKEADILEVSFSSRQAPVTASVVTAVVNSFIHIINAQNNGNTSESLALLQEEQQRAHNDYLNARKKLQSFQNQEKAVDLTAQTSFLLREQSDLESELKTTKTKLSETRSRLTFLQQETGISPEQAISVEALAGDELIQELRHKIAAQEVRVVEMRTRYQKDSPQLSRAEGNLKQLQDALTERTKALSLAGISNLHPEGLPENGPIKRDMLEDMVRARADEMAQQTRLDSLQSSLDDINTQLKDIPGQQLRLADLNRAVSVAGDQLTDVEKRLQATRLAESLTNRQSNVQIIDEPEVPSATSLPNIPNNIMLALLFGLAAAAVAWLGLFYTDPRLRNLSEISKILPLPVEAWFRNRNGNPLAEMAVAMDRLRQALNGWRTGGNKAILVISADSNSDRELVTIGLAHSFIRAGLRTAIVETDFADASLSAFLNVQQMPGILQYCNDPEGSVKLATIVRELGPDLWFVPSGASARQGYKPPAGMIGSAKFASLLKDIADKVDVVIYDLAPISQTVEGLALLTPGVKPVVVTKLGQTHKRDLKVLAAQFKHLPVSNAALVLSNAEDVPDLLPINESMRPAAKTADVTTAGW